MRFHRDYEPQRAPFHFVHFAFFDPIPELPIPGRFRKSYFFLILRRINGFDEREMANQRSDHLTDDTIGKPNVKYINLPKNRITIFFAIFRNVLRSELIP